MNDTTSTAAALTGPPPAGALCAAPMTLQTLIETIAARDDITYDEALARIWQRGTRSLDANAGQ